MAIEKFWIFVWKDSKNIKWTYNLLLYLTLDILYLLILLFMI